MTGIPEIGPEVLSALPAAANLAVLVQQHGGLWTGSLEDLRRELLPALTLATMPGRPVPPAAALARGMPVFAHVALSRYGVTLSQRRDGRWQATLAQSGRGQRSTRPPEPWPPGKMVRGHA